MSAILGSGEHRYRVIENWAQLPPVWNFKDVGGVGVDSKDRVYVFNRGEHPMIGKNRGQTTVFSLLRNENRGLSPIFDSGLSPIFDIRDIGFVALLDLSENRDSASRASLC
jgi:hypothetical protein